MRKYEQPKAEIYMLTEDILTTSGDNFGEDGDFTPLQEDELFTPVI